MPGEDFDSQNSNPRSEMTASSPQRLKKRKIDQSVHQSLFYTHYIVIYEYTAVYTVLYRVQLYRRHAAFLRVSASKVYSILSGTRTAWRSAAAAVSYSLQVQLYYGPDEVD